MKKRVQFDRATVFLVNSIKENSETELWWSDEDHARCKIEALYEINRLKTIHKSIHFKDAIRLLYQPNNIRFNEENFQ
jgi:hypothetical protein